MKTVGSRRLVFSGGAKRTAGGLKKDDLIRVPRGFRIDKKSGIKRRVFSIVSRKKNKLGKSNLWAQSIKLARSRLQKKRKKPLGFIVIKKGEPLYVEAMKIYNKKKRKLKR